jgi:hypothetical protein
MDKGGEKMTCKHLYVDEKGWSCRNHFDGVVGVKCNGKQHNTCPEYNQIKCVDTIKAITLDQARHFAKLTCGDMHDAYEYFDELPNGRSITPLNYDTFNKALNTFLVELPRKQIDYLIAFIDCGEMNDKIINKILKRLRRARHGDL